MKNFLRNLLILIITLSFVLLSTGCGKTKSDPKDEPANENTTPKLVTSDLIGTYEGEWAMSPNMKPLTSLVLLQGDKYELYVSIMGLIEEGSYAVSGKDGISFTNGGDNSKVDGKFVNGVVTAAFNLGGSPTEFTLSQVGNPDDVYKSFLGAYSTMVMGNMEVIIEFLPGQKYHNTLSDEKGKFKIFNGEIALTPDDNSTTYKGSFDLGTKEFNINMSVMPGTPNADMIFKPKTESSEISGLLYTGTSSIGMNGSTEVKLTFYEKDKFTLETTKPRATGTYSIADVNGVPTLTLTYTEPATKPDGTPFVITGVLKEKDLTVEGNTLSITSVQYNINMDGKDSLMDLGEVVFTLTP